LKKSKPLSKLNLKGFIVLISNALFEVKINSKADIGSHAQRFIVYGNSIAFVAWVYFVIAVDDIVFISDIDDSTA
jgi:hypothetical protein